MTNEDKPELQTVTNFRVMSAEECFDALGWSYTIRIEAESYSDISCPCGGEIEASGYFGTDIITCKSCGKSMADLFSPIPRGNHAVILSPDDFEWSDGRHWVAYDGEDGIMLEEIGNDLLT